MSSASIQDRELWTALSDYEFDPPGATILFADKVAQENCWSIEYTHRVIEEYRRYLFLAATGEGRVSPSDAVDQVWHRHLMYTRDYWDRLCGGILFRPLHHEPSRGSNDGARLADWKRKTLERYRQFFGEPPSDIWETSRSVKRPAFRRVDAARYWIIPRLSELRLAGFANCGLLALPFAAAGCSVAAWTSPRVTTNPLNWSGPVFLVAFTIMWFGSFGLADAIRFRFCGSRIGRLLPLFVGALVPLAGVLKIVVGVNRGRPVGILVVLTSVCFASLFVLFGPNGVFSGLDSVLTSAGSRHFSSGSVKRRSKGSSGTRSGWSSSDSGGGSSCGSDSSGCGGDGGGGGGGCGGCSS